MESLNILTFFDYWQKKNWIREYYNFDVNRFEKLLRYKDEGFWQREGAKRALMLFHLAAKRVPAYKDFLKKQQVNPWDIKTTKDFELIPQTDKENYINEYPLAKRCWDGRITDSRLIAISSGTSGEPKFWPRSEYQEFEAAVIHELLYRYSFEVDKYKTLLVICFPMGVYVSGIATVLPSYLVSTKISNLTIASTGNNKTEVLRLVKNLQEEFEQLILVGHPFFIKDVIETGRQESINWASRRLRLMFCSEGFNEIWRNYLLKEAGMPSNDLNAVNTYGSTELLLMAQETSLTILVRSILEKNADLKKHLGDFKLVPNLFQYNPFFRYVESVDKELLFTSASGLPLIRFNLHDAGEVISFKDVVNHLAKVYPKWKSRLPKNTVLWQLPFVSLRGRSDYTTIFYHANIYPEHIHIALNHRPFLRKITGKFAMRTDYLKNMDEFLEINIELRPGVKPNKKLGHLIQNQIFRRLRQINMEFLDTSNKFPEKTVPHIVLCQYQDEKYFRPGLKPKYILK